MNKVRASFWGFFILLFAGAAFSYAAMFRGDLVALFVGIACLIAGILCLKYYLTYHRG